MAFEGKGIIGSVAVHLGIMAVLVGASWFVARHEGEKLEAVDPLLVDLNGIPGKRPGEKEKAAGLAQGSESGTKQGISRVQIKKIDLEKIQQEQTKADAAENSARQPSAKSMAKSGSKAGPAAGKTSLNEYLSSKSGRRGPGKSAGIGGVSVKMGRPTGTGDNGGEGGAASEQQIYAGEVLARFRTAWAEIIATDGASIAAAGNCGVTLAVDVAGNVSFSGWVTKPKDATMAELVRRACAQIGNCGKPPAGKSFSIDFPKVNVSDS